MKKYIIILFIFLIACKGGKQEVESEKKLNDIVAYIGNTLEKMEKVEDKKENITIFDTFLKEINEKLEGLAIFIKENKEADTPEFQERLSKEKLVLIKGWRDTKVIAFEKNYLYDIFRNYLSRDIQLYINIKEREPFINCKGISSEEFKELLYYESEFIEKFTESSKFEEVKGNYISDMLYYISEAEAFKTNKSGEQIISSMRTFIQKYPRSYATEILKFYLNRQGKIKTVEIEKLVREELDKQIDKLYFLFK